MNPDIQSLLMSIDEIIKDIQISFDGHAQDHISRVLNYALRIQSKEGGDIAVIAVSAYLHDIHRWISQDQQYISPDKCLDYVKNIIERIPVSQEQKKKILFAIENHDKYNFDTSKTNHICLEADIIQDADNLDAIGAIGIGRAFTYGAIHKIPNYVPTVEFYRNEYTEEINDVSTIHHIYNKLLRIEQTLNTETAKTMARKRTQFMSLFFEQFLAEWQENNSI